MSWWQGTDNRKRNPRIAKKVAKHRRTMKGVTLLLGQAFFYPGLTAPMVRSLKRQARELDMCHARRIFEHLAVHKRYGYDTVKLRIRKPKGKDVPGVHTTVYSKLIARKDIAFWKTQLDVFEVMEMAREP